MKEGCWAIARTGRACLRACVASGRRKQVAMLASMGACARHATCAPVQAGDAAFKLPDLKARERLASGASPPSRDQLFPGLFLTRCSEMPCCTALRSPAQVARGHCAADARQASHGSPTQSETKLAARRWSASRCCESYCMLSGVCVAAHNKLLRPRTVDCNRQTCSATPAPAGPSRLKTSIYRCLRA